MQPPTNFFDAVGLKQAENTYRERLRAQPDDMALRLSLAWCLFMQAVHQSGQEVALHNAVLVSDQAVVSCTGSVCQARSAQALLRDCLHQTYTIKHLSVHVDDHEAVERLQALVELTGARDMAVVAERQSLEKLVSLASAVSQSTESDCH